MKKQDKVTLGLAIGAAIAASLLASPDAKANPGDQEDAPSWSCVMDGNHVCGPHNAMGAVPGLYDATGKLQALWPVIRHCSVDTYGDAWCNDDYVSPQFVKITSTQLTTQNIS